MEVKTKMKHEHTQGDAVYIIHNLSTGLWMMNHMTGGCGVPTCLWGAHKRDAKGFDSKAEAHALAEQIGGCEVIQIDAYAGCIQKETGKQ